MEGGGRTASTPGQKPISRRNLQASFGQGAPYNSPTGSTDCEHSVHHEAGPPGLRGAQGGVLLGVERLAHHPPLSPSRRSASQGCDEAVTLGVQGCDEAVQRRSAATAGELCSLLRVNQAVKVRTTGEGRDKKFSLVDVGAHVRPLPPCAVSSRAGRGGRQPGPVGEGHGGAAGGASGTPLAHHPPYHRPDARQLAQQIASTASSLCEPSSTS